MNRALAARLSCLLLAAPLLGQGTHFGIQTGLVLPMGDTSTAVNGAPGFTAGLNLPIDLKGGNTLRPHLDYILITGTQNGSGLSYKHEIRTLNLGLDYLHYFSGQTGGFYALVGVGASNTTLQTTYVSAYGFDNGYSSNDYKTAFAWDLGLGSQLTPTLGAELRYSAARQNFDQLQENQALALSLTVRF